MSTLITFENLSKYTVLVCTLCGFYFAIKSDIRDQATEKRFQIEHLQYQITELKDCCKERSKHIVVNEPKLAVLPSETRLDD